VCRNGEALLLVDYRVALIGVNILADQLGLPIPAVPTLIVAGALIAGGQLSAVAVFTAALAGCVLADTAWYIAGRTYGNGVMKLLCRISLTPDSCVSDTQARFERWGANALLVAKFIPGLSIIAPPLAGATHMRWLRFVLFSVLGSGAWVGLAMLTGVLFRAQVEQLLPRLLELGARAALLLGAVLALYIAYKWYERARFFALLRSARISAEELPYCWIRAAFRERATCHCTIWPAMLRTCHATARSLPTVPVRMKPRRPRWRGC
jgi:membrane protein DedA with SNARE-associated domain